MSVLLWNSKEEKCFHNNIKCVAGQKIKPENRKEGTGNKSLCPDCAKLNADAK